MIEKKPPLILELESRIERVITHEKTLADEAMRLRSIPRGPSSLVIISASGL